MKHLLLTRQLTKGQLKQVMYDTWGISRDTAERYLRRARAEIVADYEAETGENMAESAAQAVHFLRSTFLNQSERTRERIRAVTEFNKMIGSHKPAKMAITDSSGNDRPLRDAPDDDLRAAVRLRERLMAADEK